MSYGGGYGGGGYGGGYGGGRGGGGGGGYGGSGYDSYADRGYGHQNSYSNGYAQVVYVALAAPFLSCIFTPKYFEHIS